MAQLQRRRPPSRMTLSPKVSRPPSNTTPNSRVGGRQTTSPFAGMNKTTADIRRAPPTRSEAEERRSSRGRIQPKKERDQYHALKMQRALAPVSYGRRTAIKERISDTDSFNDFPLLPSIRDGVYNQALAGMEDVVPTPVQRLAIPALLGNESRAARRKSSGVTEKKTEQFLLAAETGSGKTLAYLLPVLDAIKRAEAMDAEEEAARKLQEEKEKQTANYRAVEPPPFNAPHPTTGRPRAIILLPTSELVTQVSSLAKLLSHTVKFRSAPISSAYSGKVIRNRLFAPTGIDVLISTPHLLASVSESDPNILSRVSHLVIDEADSLLDRSFAPSTSIIIDKATPSLQQLILCSATIPRSLDSYLRNRFPDMRRFVTPNLHAIPRRVQLGVIDVEKEPYRGNKSLACADTIWTIGKMAAEKSLAQEGHADVKRILAFVNEREKTQEVAEYLVSKGIDAVALNRDTPEQRQSETLSAFTTIKSETVEVAPADLEVKPSGPNYVPFSRDAPSAAPAPTRRRLPNTKVLVSTDLGSRGIDTLAVRHVILYDVPHTTIDFIHRLGRTGRMGRRGRGIVLVGRNDRKDVIREVREGMYKGQALI